MDSTEERLNQITQTRWVEEPSAKAMAGQNRAVAGNGQMGGRRFDGENHSGEVNSLLRTLWIEVPRFDGTNVENWIYKINKFFDLQQVDPKMRLSVVAFHLDGEPSVWYQ